MMTWSSLDKQTQQSINASAGRAGQVGLRWTLLSGIYLVKSVIGFITDMLRQLAGK
jgi:hypothetical protein